MENKSEPISEGEHSAISGIAPEQAQQKDTSTVRPQSVPSVASSGRRQAFQDLKRNLTEADLANPGTQKLILEMLSNAEDDRDDYKTYVNRYYEVHERAAILGEKLQRNIINEIMFTVGFGGGCAIMGLATYFWNPATAHGQLCLAVGAVFAIGFAAARIAHVVRP